MCSPQLLRLQVGISARLPRTTSSHLGDATATGRGECHPTVARRGSILNPLVVVVSRILQQFVVVAELFLLMCRRSRSRLSSGRSIFSSRSTCTSPGALRIDTPCRTSSARSSRRQTAPAPPPTRPNHPAYSSSALSLRR
eukprot:6604964-Prymnesium_polylepis.1